MDLPDQDLGLALFARNADKPFTTLPTISNHVTPQNGQAHWYVAAMWDQEGTETLDVRDPNPAHRNWNGTAIPAMAKPTRETFIAYARLPPAPASATPPPRASSPKPPPPKQLPPIRYTPCIARTRKRSTSLRQAADRTAAKWEPVIAAAAPGTDRQVQRPRLLHRRRHLDRRVEYQKGYFWTGSFWTGELWKLLRATPTTSATARWAELWTARLLGIGVRSRTTTPAS